MIANLTVWIWVHCEFWQFEVRSGYKHPGLLYGKCNYFYQKVFPQASEYPHFFSHWIQNSTRTAIQTVSQVFWELVVDPDGQYATQRDMQNQLQQRLHIITRNCEPKQVTVKVSSHSKEPIGNFFIIVPAYREVTSKKVPKTKVFIAFEIRNILVVCFEVPQRSDAIQPTTDRFFAEQQRVIVLQQF